MASIRVTAVLALAVTTIATGTYAQSLPKPVQSSGGSDVVEVAPITFIQITPLLGSGIDIGKVPSNVSRVSATQIQRLGEINVEEGLAQYVPSVNLSNQNGSPFQTDLQYRGFTVSPVNGTPQGLAVYQNGVRINESFGDTVNFDFIPTVAIREIDVISNNPVFGLNALGGALSIGMKDGFTYHGLEADFRGGSFGRLQGNLQYGKQVGNYAAYIAIEGLGEQGFRDFSQAQLLRGYGDIGYKGDQAEVHLNFTTAHNTINADGTTPVELLRQRYSSVYTTPQSSTDNLAFVNLQGQASITPTLALQGNLYFRHFDQVHVDGNTTNAQPCGTALGFLCFNGAGGENVATDTRGQPVADPTNGGTNGRVLGETDSTRINTNSEGGTLQVTSTDKIVDHENHFVAGVSYDHGATNFRGDSNLGLIQPNLVLNPIGVFLDTPTANGTIGVQPDRVRATNDYLGAYATDTFDITSRLSVTANARVNYARIDLVDLAGGLASGLNQYTRINPGVGVTYKITPDITLFGGYSEANRAPTPLELACADPNNPCILQSFLVSDPHLKQVVARTFEGGLRGSYQLPNEWGKISYNASAFRTENSNDIQQIPNTTNGFGYFANVGSTLRQGVEASVNLKNEKLYTYASYSFVDATFQSRITLSSPNNPQANADGTINVVPGDRIPAVPLHRIKFGFDYYLTQRWKVGGDVNIVSSQYLRGDASNLNKQLSGYGVVNARTSYQLTDNVQVYGIVDNLLDRRYATYGGFTDINAIPFLGLTNPRAVTPSAPFAAYAGVHVNF